MTFNEIIKANPEAGKLATKMVYEKLTGKCWHEKVMRTSMDGFHHPESHCGKCGVHVMASVRVQVPACPNNPDLLHSLDAWRELWEMYEYKLKHAMNLHQAIPGNLCPWEAQPHHHLEAALRTLEDTCPECGGTGNKESFIEDYPAIGYRFKGRVDFCTCTDGKVDLYKLWERRVS